METIKESNKFSFGLGIFLFLTFGIQLAFKKIEIYTLLGFLFGMYNIWEHGFVKDSSRWRFKPIFFVVFSVVALSLAIGIIYYNKNNYKAPINSTKKNLAEEIAIRSNKKLPMPMGTNGDSIIKINVIDKNTLEYLYKLNVKISQIESATLNSFESDTKRSLLNKLNELDREIISEYKGSNLKFIHNYVDIEGNVIGIIQINTLDY
jgi:hypothetical protein